jgi:hypothetical protein
MIYHLFIFALKWYNFNRRCLKMNINELKNELLNLKTNIIDIGRSL